MLKRLAGILALALGLLMLAPVVAVAKYDVAFDQGQRPVRLFSEGERSDGVSVTEKGGK